VALAEPGKVYVIYLPHGGATTVDLSAANDPLGARWLNPRTGGFANAAEMVNGGVRQEFRAPDENDWALLLTSADSK